MAWARGFAGGVLRRAGRDVPTVTVPEASGGGGRRVCHGIPAMAVRPFAGTPGTMRRVVHFKEQLRDDQGTV